MRTFRGVCSAAAIALWIRQVAAQCEVYGIDFVNGGSYFQNSDSDAPFTAVQEFSGCQNDAANNILVDPHGNQYQCSDTPLLPDYTPESLTCSTETKNNMFSGEWSILIISNNGDGDPIDYQRDFSLSVGPQQTSTVTPTVTVTAIQTSISSIYDTTTSTITTTLVPSTVTKHGLFNLNLDLTSFVLPDVSVHTSTAAIITQTEHKPSVSVSVSQVEASCAPPKPNFVADPQAIILANIIGSHSNKRDIAGAKFRRAMLEREAISSDLKSAFIAERHERLAAALHKRAPDQPTITVTISATSDFATTTSTSIAATSDVTLTTTDLSTVTSSPSPVTITKALFNLNVNTILRDLLQPTITQWVVATETKTLSVPSTAIITSTTTSESAAEKCQATGGALLI